VRSALVLIDLQSDYLAAARLCPSAPELVARATVLLSGFRSRGVPVIHVWTTVDRGDDRRMPHWRRADRWACVEGSAGHEPPAPLEPAPGEFVVHKTFYSGFEGSTLDDRLRSLGCTEIIVAGVHTHGCVRSSVLDAYQRGYEVTVADDATGSDDPVHAAVTRRYLLDRACRFETVDTILAHTASANRPTIRHDSGRLAHFSPRDPGRLLWEVPVAGRPEVARAARAARRAGESWQDFPPAERAGILLRLAERLGGDAEALAVRIAEEVGKPITQARGEVRRTRDILQDVASRAGESVEVASAPDASYRFRPLGVIGLVTPWNNPLAIPVGKIAPALLYGNAVVWKPAPAGTGVALRLLELLETAGCPGDAVSVVTGDQTTARHLAEEDRVDAVTLSGSLHAGYALQEICARRCVPFQAELGGNNAAIICTDADLPDAATRVAEAAFGFAGQRCTANRRVVVAAGCYEEFLSHLQTAAAGLIWGDPMDPATQVGPLISAGKRKQVATLVARSAHAARAVLVPHRGGHDEQGLPANGAYYPPTIVCVDDPGSEIVREETFGPVLVVQRAADFPEALELCNGVRQGLVAALFSKSTEHQDQFLRCARAGILKLNRATADADATTPFGGWKASGIGPAEHGPSDREFYTRTQAVYRRVD
jgi:acyl-CoA reductase-like NAD-dependent aldehyde dehydrogenase/nicotinamidase-related amidase